MIPGSSPPSNNRETAAHPGPVVQEAADSKKERAVSAAGFSPSRYLQGASALLCLLVLAGTIGIPYRPVSYLNASYVYPVMAPRMSSGYGRRVHPIKRFSSQHTGIDLAAPLGSPIRAISAGTVVFADPYAGYGNLVVVQHKSSLTSHYGHCHELKVRTGQRVRAGEIIGYIGSTGMSTGPHLHFEMRIDAKPLDPEKLIPGLATAAEG